MFKKYNTYSKEKLLDLLSFLYKHQFSIKILSIMNKKKYSILKKIKKNISLINFILKENYGK